MMVNTALWQTAILSSWLTDVFTFQLSFLLILSAKTVPPTNPVEKVLLTLFALGGAGPSKAWGGVNLTHTFWQLPAYWATMLSILILILFKERINDYLEKKLGQYLKNWPTYCNFCRPKFFLKIFEIFLSKLEITVTRPFFLYIKLYFFANIPIFAVEKDSSTKMGS